MTHIADNHDALLDYLYEEGEPGERLKIAKHLQECARCSVAVLELQTVRGMLGEWTPPEAQLGFRIVQEHPASVEPVPSARSGPGGSARPHWWTTSSGWAQAAAAVLLFAAGMAVSQVSYDTTEQAVPPVGAGRLGWISLPEESAPPAEESDDALLRRVREMIEQSEARQQRELALRLSQVANEVETQHRADLLGIQQEMETGINQQQQQFMDYLVRTSGGTR
jgi:hypothetical protein